jgi:8-oxo-dGTP pyrophosphatase MutT (NUDIX family)
MEIKNTQPIPTWFFAVVLVRMGHRVLLVEEQDNKGWYFPAGKVEAGETLEGAAIRETKEEAGIPIILEGILRIEHGVGQGGVRCRVFYVARPRDDTPPKTEADQWSVRAAWATTRDLEHMKLRGDEVREVIEYVMNGGHVYPLDVWVLERAPWQ